MSDVQQEMDEILNEAMTGEGEEAAVAASESPAEAETETPQGETVESDAQTAAGAETGEKDTAGSPPAEDAPSENPEVAALKAELGRVREQNRAQKAELDARNALNQQPPFWMTPQGQQVPQGVPAQQQPGALPQDQRPAGPEFFDLYDAEGNPVQIANPDFAVRQAMQPLQARLDAQDAMRVDSSEAAARAKYQDFDHAVRGFLMATQVNPSLVHQMRAAPDPGEFAYRIGLAVAGTAPIPAPTGAQTQVTPQTTNQSQAAPAPPAPKLPGSLSDKAAPGGALTAPPEPADPLDEALPKYFE